MRTLQKAESLASFQTQLLQHEDDIMNEQSYSKMGDKQKRDVNKRYLFPLLTTLMYVSVSIITYNCTIQHSVSQSNNTNVGDEVT